MVDVTHFLNLAHTSFVAKNARAPRVGDFSRGKIAILFVVLMAIASIPILLHPLPPISDYINHLARMHVIATINSDPDLHRYYEIDWQVIPNLMMDLIVPLFVRVMNVYLAGQLYTILSFALIVSAHGRAPSSALWALVRVAADRVSVALQQRLPRGYDELRVRHRARALGVGGLGRVARAQPRVAARSIVDVRPCVVLLPPVRARGLRRRAAGIRVAALVDRMCAPAPLVRS